MIEEKNPFKNCVWIGADALCSSPVFIRDFKAQSVSKAVLKITGLGFFRAKINGKAVCEDRYVPNVTDYESRDTQKFLYPIDADTTHRIYYCEYDVTNLLSEENLLEIQLGNGWYRQKERVAEGDTSFGDVLKTVYQLEIEDNEGVRDICSDGTEKWYESEIAFNNIFYGEKIDPTQVSGKQYPVKVLEAPNAIICEQQGAVDKVIRIIEPKLLGVVDGKKIFDVGENISGVARVYSADGAHGQIVLRFSEKISQNLQLDFMSTGAKHISPSGVPQIMQDTFICDGTKRVFEPTFVWHAFRYFEIEGDFDKVEVLVIHSNTDVTAEFESDSEGLNYLFNTFIRTQLNNMHSSIPSDCPHRERLAYTGDGQVCAQASMLFLDCREFYKKWIIDILDCQDVNTGHVQHTAPFMGGGGGPCGWGGAIILVPYQYYLQYGDKSVLEYCYNPMKRFIDYLITCSENGLIVKEESEGWCLGDWCTPNEIKIPPQYVNSCFFIKFLDIMVYIAKTVNRTQDIPFFEGLKEKAVGAVKNTFLDSNSNSFCGGVQGADAYAVWTGLSGAEAAEKIAEKYAKLGYLDTGFLGTDILFEVLFEYGYADVALQLLESDKLGSFLYMKNKGATTFWETWFGGGSHNHPMFGACSRQLMTSILGIRQEPESCGYKHIKISPQIPKKLAFASGKISSVSGEIEVSWCQDNNNIFFEITIPSGVKASFEYNGETCVLYSGKNKKCISKFQGGSL